MSTFSLTRSKYFITFIDDYIRYTLVSFLSDKSAVLDHFKVYKACVENQLQTKIQILRTDNGVQYASTSFTRFYQVEGILHQFTVPYNPQQNGVAERKNRSLMEAVRSMIRVADLPHSYWEEAVATAAYL